MSIHQDLAERLEAADEPIRDLEVQIWKLNGRTCPEGHAPLAWLACYMTSIDAAIALVPADRMAEVMRMAISRLSRRFALHIRRWDPALRYDQYLARHVAAVALRVMGGHVLDPVSDTAIAEFLRQEPDAEMLGIAAMVHRDRSLENNHPMGGVWSMICLLLPDEGNVKNKLPPATDEMVQAGEDAYRRKLDDMGAVSPTEHPDDGGGPIGYAWRAMVAKLPAHASL